MMGPSQRPSHDNTQHSQRTEFHAGSGIRTCNPSNSCLRPLAHCDPQRRRLGSINEERRDDHSELNDFRRKQVASGVVPTSYRMQAITSKVARVKISAVFLLVAAVLLLVTPRCHFNLTTASHIHSIIYFTIRWAYFVTRASSIHRYTWEDKIH